MQDAKNPDKREKPAINLDTARRRFAFVVLICAVVGGVLFVVFRPFRGAETLLNVSYDATREFYGDLNEAFTRSRAGDGESPVKVEMLHAGSSAQARGLAGGMMADVVTLATAADLDAISRAGVIAKNWRERLPHGSSPYSSTIVFLVRKGNPRQIRDWDDLARDEVQVVCPDPNVSGAGRWAYLAVWGSILRSSGNAGQAEKGTWRVFWKAILVPRGARSVLEQFVRSGEGDVLLTWENEAHYALNAYGADRFEIVYPPASILAEPVVSVLDRYVDRRGTRADAEAYLRFLFSREGQETAARHYLRPQMQGVETDGLPAIERFTVEEVFGGWESACKAHFDKGGTYDQIVKLRRLEHSE